MTINVILKPDQTKICSDILQIELKPLLNKFKEHRIFLSDTINMKNKLLFESSQLLRVDITEKLFIGEIRKLKQFSMC